MTIEVYGRSNCSYCSLAKSFLDKKGVEYKYIDVQAEGFDLDNLTRVTAPGARSVPIIVINGKWIGGYTELVKELK